MCPRRVHGGPLLSGLELTEIDLETFKKWFSDDFIRQLGHLMMCGNLGDPIIAKDTLSILKYIRSVNPKITLHMHTNGSARAKEWWEALAKTGVEVTFGIDGLKDTHALYRVNTDWNKIIDNAKAFISAGGYAAWHMLVFKHNEHQIEVCQQISRMLGFKHFSVKHTTRFKQGKFDAVDEDYKITHTLYPSTKSLTFIEPIKIAEKELLPIISCKAQEDNQIYISATGNVAPCCWLDLEWLPDFSEARIDYMIKINSYPNLYKESLEKIFNSGYFNKIKGCWSSTGLKECSKQCGSFDKLKEQFER
jgi:sulfatase maturation enzyme AslB (radical SAM superfamily)